MKQTVAAAVLAGISSASFAFGTGNMPVVPSGWTLKESYTSGTLNNIRVYQKTGESTYMQVVDIKNGGRISFFNQAKTGASPFQFGINSMDNWWNMLVDKKTMVNGQFFALWNTPPFQINPTTLSFGVKSCIVAESSLHLHFPRVLA